jgi:hypothetical protein
MNTGNKEPYALYLLRKEGPEAVEAHLDADLELSCRSLFKLFEAGPPVAQMREARVVVQAIAARGGELPAQLVKAFNTSIVAAGFDPEHRALRPIELLDLPPPEVDQPPQSVVQ